MNKVAEKRSPIRCGLVRPCSLEKEGTLSPPFQRLLDDVVGVQESYLMRQQARLDAQATFTPLRSLRLLHVLRERAFMSAAEIAGHIKVATSSIKRAIEEMVEGRG